MPTKLKDKIAPLSLPKPVMSNASPTEKNITGKTFLIEPNVKNVKQLSFQFNNNVCYATILTDTAVYKISFGSGKWNPGETTMHGPYLVERAKENLKGLPPFKIDGSYNWKDDNTLELVLRYIESPHTEKLVCHFDGNKISVSMQNSFDYGKKEIVLNGESDK